MKTRDLILRPGPIQLYAAADMPCEFERLPQRVRDNLLKARAWGGPLGAITATPYGQTFLGQYSATAARRIDWVTDTIDCALCTSTYTPNRDTHVFYSALTNEVANGNGYTTGGVALANKSTSYDSTSHEARFFADPSTWTGASFTFRYAVLYKSTGTGSTSPLIGWVDFGGDEQATSATVTITWDATNGAFKVAG